MSTTSDINCARWASDNGLTLQSSTTNQLHLPHKHSYTFTVHSKLDYCWYNLTIFPQFWCNNSKIFSNPSSSPLESTSWIFLSASESYSYHRRITCKADARLFSLVRRPEHCRHHLLPVTINSCSMELRHRRRSFPLPQFKYNLYKNSCISRCLFKYV